MTQRGRRHTSSAQSDKTDRDFVDALQRGLRGDIDFKSAQLLFDAASRPSRRIELFSTAARIRDKKLGRRLLLSAHIHMITDCEVSPSCLYCSLSGSERAVNKERAWLTMRELGQGVRLAVERGVQSIVLVGGTNLNGLDSRVRQAVEKARDVTDVDLAVDVGPSLSRETVRWLKDEKVDTVHCSIETANAKAFADAKPGDSLEARVRFMKMVESEGVKLGNVVMNGLGSTSDLLKSILYLRRFKTLSHLYISTFHPVGGTPWAPRRPASVQTSLRALPIARLAFPDVHLGLAEVEVEDSGSVARTPSQLAAGGGNALAGMLIYKKRRVDNMELIRSYAASLGFETAA